MSEANGKGGGNGKGAENQQFLLQQLYVKDMSFEAPNTPAMLMNPAGEPDVQLNLKNSHKLLDEHRHEVVLHLSVHARINDQSMFLVELDQAGVFYLEGFDTEETRRLLGVFCPNTLFPYAREAISSMVAKGGFPPLVLQPINFDALYEQAAQRQQQQIQA